MISDAFGVGVARAVMSAGAFHAAHAAGAAALKHRAAVTDASVVVGGPPKAR